MATGSGLSTQYGVADESVYGTFVTPTRFLEYKSESIALDIERIESSALRSTNRVLRVDRFAANKKGAAGVLQFEVANTGFGLILKHCFGAAPVIDTNALPTGTLVTAKHFKFVAPSDPTGLSFTTQIGTPDVGGVVRPFNYTGCKVASWELSQAVDDFLQLKVTVDAQNEDTVTNALAAASYPTSQTMYDYSMCVATIGGSAVDIKAFDLTVDNALATDRYFLRGQTLKKEPIPNAMMGMTGSLDMEFIDLTQYARFLSSAGNTPLTLTWTGAPLPGGDAAKNSVLKLTMANVRFDGASPDVSGADIIQQSLPFKVLWDGTNPAIQLDMNTSDVAA